MVSRSRPTTSSSPREWIVDPANASVSAGVYSIIKSMEAVDPQTVKVSFADPNANWFEPHAGTTWGYVYPKHVLDTDDKKAAHDAFLLNPVGTGPYKVESFCAERPGHLRRQRQLSRAEQALLRQGQPQGRWRCAVGGAGGAADRRL